MGNDNKKAAARSFSRAVSLCGYGRIPPGRTAFIRVPCAAATLEHIAAQPKPRIFLSAGEASGDHYGAQVIAELYRRRPGAAFLGLGGSEMAAAGLERIVRAEDVAHMGITEVLRHMPYIFRQYRKLVAVLQGSRRLSKPDIAILIDFPDVNFRLAKHCRRLGIPVVWFVSPQLWAWKRRRLRWVQQRVAKMLVIFPFERDFYRSRGVDAEFVGHPLAALPLPDVSREAYAAEHTLDSARHWIALLPGSRTKEIAANLPTMLEAAALLGSGYEVLLPVASTIKLEDVGRLVFTEILPRLQWPSGSSITLVPDARAALYQARTAIVASGTATVQALTLGNPFIVVYRVSALTFWLAKRLIRYPAEIPAPLDAEGNLPIAMVNLIAGRRIVPEYINARFTAQNLAAALGPLLADTPERARMTADLDEARTRLLPSADASPMDRVCDAIEALLPAPLTG